jgi:flagellar export protein FliJ
MKALKRLIRLRKQKVDEHQQFLGMLQERLNKLEQELKMIHHHLQAEQCAATQSIEGTIAYVQYAATMKIRLEQVERLYKESMIKYEQEQQKLQELFGELKVLEIYHAEETKRHQKKIERRNQVFLDDLYARQA